MCFFSVGDARCITDADLLRAGIMCGNDRKSILNALHLYEKEKCIFDDSATIIASAPTLPFEEASAPLPDDMRTISSSECVICLDSEVMTLFPTFITSLRFFFPFDFVKLIIFWECRKGN